MLKIFVGLISGLALSAYAFAQDLPASVTEPYAHFLRAVNAGDDEAAAQAAQAALSAAQSASVDAGTLAVFAENAAVYAVQTDDLKRGMELYAQSAELHETAGSEPLIIAARWRFAAEAAYRAGEDNKARRFGDAAGDRLEQMDGSAERDYELSRARGVQAQAAWRQGDVRTGGARAKESFEAWSQTGLDYRLDHAAFAFYAGVSEAVERADANAAYWFSAAHWTFCGLDFEGDTVRIAHAWLGYARRELSEIERARLSDRITAAGFDQPSYPSDCVGDGHSRRGEARPWDIDARPIERRAPSYPRQAQGARLDGIVLVEFDIDAAGQAEDIEVLYSVPHSIFGEAAARAVRRWRYEPATRDGAAVRRPDMIAQFRFRIED